MARFAFRIPRRPASRGGTAITFRMMEIPSPDEAPGVAGWHESSRDLALGLTVIEGPPEDPFDAWFSA